MILKNGFLYTQNETTYSEWNMNRHKVVNGRISGIYFCYDKLQL